jgi:nicotinate phosphoribosyltransferase
LTAIRDDASAPWEPRVKLSEQTVKISTPGVLQVRRYRTGSESIADAIFDTNIGVPDEAVIVDPLDMTRRKHIPRDAQHEDLLVPIFRAGRRVYDMPEIRASRQRAFDQLATFHPGIKRFVNPHRYPVGLEQRLHDLRTELILKARRFKNEPEDRPR